MNIEKEVASAAGLKVMKKGVDRQEYLKKMVEVVTGDEFADDDWEKLSPAAQNWVNAAGTAINAGKDAPDPDGKPNGKDKPAKKSAKAEDVEESEDEGEEESEDDGDEDEGEQDAKPAKKVKGKDKPAAKGKDDNKKAAKGKDKPAKKSAKPDKEKKQRGGPDGMKIRIKKAILKKPSISTEDLIAELGDGENAPSKFTVSNIRAEFRHSLKVLADLGLLTKELKL